MKRTFHEFDSRLPKKLLERFPVKAEHLKRIAEMEDEIETRWACFRRTALEGNCEPTTKPKVLRVYIRHSFVASTPEERSFFLVTVEGRLLDGMPVEDEPFGRFFDAIRVVPDRKYNVDNMLFEWTKEQFPAGGRAQCMRFKLYCDRTLPVTIRLTRSEYAVKRYELSSGLRQLFPKLPLDPTEDDVLAALWEYVKMYDLCLDKTVVRCDENLRRITEAEHISLSNLKATVMSHLFPCKSIDIEYSLNTTSFSDIGLTDTDKDKRYGAAAYSKSGGKCFDLNVDIVDTENHKILDILNRGSKREENMQAEFDKVQGRSSYLLRALHRCERDLLDVQALTTAPLPLSLLLLPSASSDDGAATTSSPEESAAETALGSKAKRAMTSHLPLHFQDTHPSEMHGLGTYLDVSQDAVFSSAKYNWLTKAAYDSSFSSH